MSVPQIKQTFMSGLDCRMRLVESMLGASLFRDYFRVLEWSIALRGMITFRKWVKAEREIGQCRTSGFGVSASFQTAVRLCRHSRPPTPRALKGQTA